MKNLDERAFQITYGINRLVIKSPKSPDKPYEIFYNGLPLRMILTTMSMIEEYPEMKSKYDDEILSAIEELEADARWGISVERSE